MIPETSHRHFRIEGIICQGPRKQAKRKQDSFVSIPLSFCLSSVNIIKGICLLNVAYRLEDSADCQNFLIACIGNNNTGLGIGCVNDLSASDIERHMSGITDQISRLCIG